MLSNADKKRTKDVEGNTRKPSVADQRGCVTRQKKKEKKRFSTGLREKYHVWEQYLERKGMRNEVKCHYLPSTHCKNKTQPIFAPGPTNSLLNTADKSFYDSVICEIQKEGWGLKAIPMRRHILKVKPLKYQDSHTPSKTSQKDLPEAAHAEVTPDGASSVFKIQVARQRTD